jgi:phosphatidylglycerol:prolipoprotein diacylglycerol transferase
LIDALLTSMATATEALRGPFGIDPIALQIGPLALRWYSLAYLVGIILAWWYLLKLLKQPGAPMARRHADDLVFYGTLGVILGGRLGYVLFYNLGYYVRHPLEVIIPFRSGAHGMEFTGISGMSYHGGLIGCALACWWFCRRQRGKGGREKSDFWNLADLFFPAIPLGYTFGRIANFINGELWGRVTASPVGMYFPAAPGGLPRHPSQLYEAFFEGIALFILLWALRRRGFAKGSFLGLYLIGYGVFRFFIEYFREPDAQLGLYWFGMFSQGQALCLGMILAGAGFVIWRKRQMN